LPTGEKDANCDGLTGPSGPVLHDDKIYFAAGVFPLEGVFLYALDAETGKVVWLNDDCGYLFGQHPHNAESLGGITPQGYVAIGGNELVVPCGQALPARFDVRSGKLVSFVLPKPGRLPGGWFASPCRPSVGNDQKVVRKVSMSTNLSSSAWSQDSFGLCEK